MNEHLQEYAEKARSWHYIWKKDGRKWQGIIADIRRRTRVQYHYAIKLVKKQQIRLRNIKMGEAIADNNDRLLWDEVKKISSTNNKLHTAMDGCNGTDEISNIFKDKYETL